MSFITTLQFEPVNHNSNPLRVLSCDWRFTQMTDPIGKPTSIPKGGIINITVETDGDNYLYDWMIHPTMQKSGIIVFHKADLVSRLKIVKFIDAFCVSYFETFNLAGVYPRQIHLVISPRKFVMGDIAHINNWPETYETA